MEAAVAAATAAATAAAKAAAAVSAVAAAPVGREAHQNTARIGFHECHNVLQDRLRIRVAVGSACNLIQALIEVKKMTQHNPLLNTQ